MFDAVNPDYIMNFAAYGNHNYQKDFEMMVKANILATYNILETARYYDYKLFYNVTTSSTMLSRQTGYSITKYCGEQITNLYERTINVMPYSVYGPGESEYRLIPTVISRLISGRDMILEENAVHSWIYIDDFIKAMLEGKTELGGKQVKNIEIVKILEEISGKKLHYTPGRLRDYDCGDARPPKPICYTSLEDGLKRTYEHFTRKDNRAVQEA
jgi:nucleoside-diphosphate-sugar epimerase